MPAEHRARQGEYDASVAGTLLRIDGDLVATARYAALARHQD